MKKYTFDHCLGPLLTLDKVSGINHLQSLYQEITDELGKQF
ncbi:hypothetical protein [Vibrio sp. RE86]|nr:hypothetical protein [Vibrio sp. RE86]